MGAPLNTMPKAQRVVAKKKYDDKR